MIAAPALRARHAKVPRRRQAVALGMQACLGAALGLAAGACAAETQAVSDSGFTVVHSAVLEAEPQAVWQAFTQLPRWWNPRHSWSGQPGRMSLDVQAGGCWCEHWGEGASAMHGRVLMAQPGSVLRLQAWLGPLQERAVSAVLTLATARREGQTRLRLTYTVAGSTGAGLDRLAGPVDAVMGEAFQRLQRYIETGRPEQGAAPPGG